MMYCSAQPWPLDSTKRSRLICARADQHVRARESCACRAYAPTWHPCRCRCRSCTGECVSGATLCVGEGAGFARGALGGPGSCTGRSITCARVAPGASGASLGNLAQMLRPLTRAPAPPERRKSCRCGRKHSPGEEQVGNRGHALEKRREKGEFLLYQCAHTRRARQGGAGPHTMGMPGWPELLCGGV
jgi:hypothetical protein